jgi:transcriptional regulator with XRE-family HTH domain
MAHLVKPDRALTPATLRAARALLGWTQLRLATEAGVSVRTVKAVETAGSASGDTEPLRCRPATAERLHRALANAGIGIAWHGAVLAVTLDTGARRQRRRG